MSQSSSDAGAEFAQLARQYWDAWARMAAGKDAPPVPGPSV